MVLLVKQFHGTRGIHTNYKYRFNASCPCCNDLLKNVSEDIMCLYHELNGSNKQLSEIEAGVALLKKCQDSKFKPRIKSLNAIAN